jgi:hypothetical protein|tara:strand:+ start:254 stop:397 length:144 start_codon:yes stop_codon:yes gene_type:complete
MKLERSNVDFPLWRKKVDKSLHHLNAAGLLFQTVHNSVGMKAFRGNS